MQLSLRVANALELELQEFVENIPCDSVSISVYETDVSAAVAAERADVLRNLEMSERAGAVLSALNTAMEHASVTSGVARLVAEQERLESRRNRLEDLARDEPVRIHVLAGRLEAARAPSDHYRQESVQAEVLSEVDLNRVRRDLIELKRQLRELANTIVDREGDVMVDLPEVHVPWFREQGML
jgi:hypothetical protein